MSRWNKIAVFSTRSGRTLAEKVCAELSSYVDRRSDKLHNKSKNLDLSFDEKDERDHIARLHENNRYLNSGESADFSVRHSKIENFLDGEIHLIIEDLATILEGETQEITNSVRGQDVYLIHCPYEHTCTPEELLDKLRPAFKNESWDQATEMIKTFKDERSINDNMIEAFIYLYTLSECGADRLNFVSPYSPYSRQDHGVGREAITAKLIAKLTEAARLQQTRLRQISTHFHSDQIAGFYDIEIDNLKSYFLIQEAIKGFIEEEKIDPEKITILGPDLGSAKLTEYHARGLSTFYNDHVDFAVGNKERPAGGDNKIKKLNLVGNIKEGNHMFVIDDMVDTAGSMVKLIEHLERYNPAGIYIACTHPILSGPAVERLDQMYSKGTLKGVLATDSISRGSEFMKDHPWMKEVSLAPMLAETIYKLNVGRSVSNVYTVDVIHAAGEE